MARVREGLLLALLLTPGGAPAVEVGQVAPSFSVPSFDPRQVISVDDYRGKVVYLDFWSTWCAPCRRAMPELSALRDQFSRDDFEVVAVNVDPVDADVRRFLARVRVSYPVGMDAAARSATTFQVTTFPAGFLIDREGIVQHVYRGAADVGVIGEQVRRLVDRLPQRQALSGERNSVLAASSRDGSPGS